MTSNDISDRTAIVVGAVLARRPEPLDGPAAWVAEALIATVSVT